MNPTAETSIFRGLEPAHVWSHFADLCRIPRASKAEDAVREHVRAWAQARGLSCKVDPAGNLLIHKPATPGKEGAPGVVLQAHLDMVCQKNADSPHDFARDPIRAERVGEWVVARDTTLGADNGIGVALILAALETGDFPHGPLEALLTVDEEAGMGGAHGLAAGQLAGRLMLNLDTEDWGEFFIGCAGGLDVNVERPGAAEPAPVAHRHCRIALRGLRGGHSGVDIHEQRGNAIKLLVRVLRDLESRVDLRLTSLKGGTARNAIPREAFAEIAIAESQVASLDRALAAMQATLREELAGVDEDIRIDIEATGAAAVLTRAEQGVWLSSLHAAPCGVRSWSRTLPGVVETSNNLGVVAVDAQGGVCNFMVRSLRDPAAEALADEIVSLFALSNTRVEKSGHYPGWTPVSDSAWLALCRDVYRAEFGGDSRVQVIHAGLECGLIGALYPDMQIVSFGPTIRGAHAPGERVEIASVGRAWHLLVAILGEVANQRRGGDGS